MSATAQRREMRKFGRKKVDVIRKRSRKSRQTGEALVKVGEKQ